MHLKNADKICKGFKLCDGNPFLNTNEIPICSDRQNLRGILQRYNQWTVIINPNTKIGLKDPLRCIPASILDAIQQNRQDCAIFISVLVNDFFFFFFKQIVQIIGITVFYPQCFRSAWGLKRYYAGSLNISQWNNCQVTVTDSLLSYILPTPWSQDWQISTNL